MDRKIHHPQFEPFIQDRHELIFQLVCGQSVNRFKTVDLHSKPLTFRILDPIKGN